MNLITRIYLFLSNLTKYVIIGPSSRRSYKVDLVVNNRRITEVIVDPHYEEKHGDTIDDQIILGLVSLLDCLTFPAYETDGAFEYFVTDQISYKRKLYKLVWLQEENQLYIGVVNAYRR